MKIAVIAGTPVDTQMGIDYLHQRDAKLETVFLPCASDPRACHLFQVKSHEEKTATMRELYRSAIDMGIRYFFVYCNSLSSAVDFDTLSESMGVKTVTPMRAYEKLALDYNILGLLAANNQSTKGIEDRFTAVNPSGYVIGIGNLRLTEAVELYEKRVIEGVCRRAGNITEAARSLGISRQSLRYKLNKYGIDL